MSEISYHGKMKAVTFSFDDGVTQDQRLIEIFNKYNLKCTFNINSELLGTPNLLVREGVTVAHCKPMVNEVRAIYQGHEIAGHTLTHPNLASITSDDEVVRQVEQDRLALSDIAGYEVVGFAYPGGSWAVTPHVVDLLRTRTGIKYARSTTSTYSFEKQTDTLWFHPTLHHNEWDKTIALAEKFVSLTPDKPQLFYIWGHSYEFDIDNSWAKFEDLCRMLANRNDIFYGTNKETVLI